MKVILSEVPPHIQNSISYDDFTDFGEELTEADVDDDRCYFSLVIENISDLKSLLSTFQFWGVREIPMEVYDFFFSFAEKEIEESEVRDVLQEFYQYQPHVSDFEFILNWEDLVVETWINHRYTDETKKTRQTFLVCQFAKKGNLNCIISALNHGHKWDSRMFKNAAKYGHLHVLQYFAEHWKEYTEAWIGARLTDKIPWTRYCVEKAAINGHLVCMQFMIENGCDIPMFCNCASDHIECLKYLHKLGAKITGNWTYGTTSIECYDYLVANGWTPNQKVFYECIQEKNEACLLYALEKDCPQPDWTENYFTDFKSFKFVEKHITITRDNVISFFFGDYSDSPHGIEFFKYLISTYNIELSQYQFHSIVADCDVEMIKYAWDICNEEIDIKETITNVCYNHDIEAFQYLMDRLKIEWSDEILVTLYEKRNFEVLKYAYESGFQPSDDVLVKFYKSKKKRYSYNQYLYSSSITKKEMDMFIYMIENGQKLDPIFAEFAISNYNFDLLKYLHDSGCEFGDVYRQVLKAEYGSIHRDFDWKKYVDYFFEIGLRLDKELHDVCFREMDKITWLIEHECPKSEKTISLVMSSNLSSQWKMERVDYLLENGFTISGNIFTKIVNRINSDKIIEWFKRFMEKGCN